MHESYGRESSNVWRVNIITIYGVKHPESHLELPRPTPCPSGKSSKDWEHTVSLCYSLHGVCYPCPNLPRGRLYSEIGSQLVPYVAQWEWWLRRPQGIRYHVANGHWPITKCWLHGFWATYMLLICCIFNHSLGSFCSWNNKLLLSLLYSVLCVCLLLGPGNITMGCWKLSLNLSHLMVTHFRFCSITLVATKVHGDITEICSVNMDAWYEWISVACETME